MITRSFTKGKRKSGGLSPRLSQGGSTGAWGVIAAFCGLILILVVADAHSAPASGQPGFAEQVLERSDAVRFPQESFQVTVEIRTTRNGKLREDQLYRVLSKGSQNTLVLTLKPESERGQILLMKGRDLWVFLPRVSQPVRLSFAQRLVGQVSNGDIARMDFTGDYTPKLLGTESIGSAVFYLLDLTAVNRSVTYQRVRYWVRRDNYWPYKAEFYALSGRLLKSCRYEDFRRLGDKVRPTKLVMTNALNPDEQSTLEYSDLKLRSLPDRVFSKDYLKRLE